ncbi:MAG: arginine--tRNA ligase [Dehalococcoidia bacterium]|jgi:arginyl-tRNA synthetase|nr:arginine--tRNA ligase [Dehalococcoidia bacterium]
MRITAQLRDAVEEALAAAQAGGVLPAAGASEIAIEQPRDEGHGDFATNLPLRLARTMKMAPPAIAAAIVEAFPPRADVEKLEVAGPGFINITLADAWFQGQVEAIRSAGPEFGNTSSKSGQNIQVEFVSVNPTGPLHVGHARGAVIGSGLANLLEAAGADVTREYYVNDAGNQMRVYTETLYARYMQAAGQDVPLPETSYPGEYVADQAVEIFEKDGGALVGLPKEEAIRALYEPGLERNLALIREDLEKLSISYDVWFSEQSLFDTGRFDTTMGELEDAGFLVDRDGARWFASTQLGEDKDNVVIRSSGGHTYFASDIAYHAEKFKERNFDEVIDVWGADHHGHVARMKAAATALGIDPERLTIILNQIVSFKENGESLRFSKRKNVIVTVRDLVDDVGSDAVRYTFLSRGAESQMEFDLDLARKQSSDNPVYYVQYAHARLSGILRNAREAGIDWADGDVSLLNHDLEIALIRQIAGLPDVVDRAADRLEPQQIPHYATEVARALQKFYDACRVISEDEEDLPVSKARLKLVEAAQIAIARCLSLMGMNAPERM